MVIRTRGFVPAAPATPASKPAKDFSVKLTREQIPDALHPFRCVNLSLQKGGKAVEMSDPEKKILLEAVGMMRAKDVGEGVTLGDFIRGLYLDSEKGALNIVAMARNCPGFYAVELTVTADGVGRSMTFSYDVDFPDLPSYLR